MMKNKILNVFAYVILGLCLTLFIGSRFVQPSLINQESMYPTYDDHDVILVNRVAYKNHTPIKGDVVVFHSDAEGGRDFIKRVIAVSGDTVLITGGKVWVNGVEQNQDYTAKGLTPGYVNMMVPENTCFVLGDNRTVSIDSRDSSVGCVPYADIVGKVLFSEDVVLNGGQ